MKPTEHNSMRFLECSSTIVCSFMVTAILRSMRALVQSSICDDTAGTGARHTSNTKRQQRYAIEGSIEEFFHINNLMHMKEEIFLERNSLLLLT
jgi:hypothetical protein